MKEKERGEQSAYNLHRFYRLLVYGVPPYCNNLFISMIIIILFVLTVRVCGVEEDGEKLFKPFHYTTDTDCISHLVISQEPGNTGNLDQLCALVLERATVDRNKAQGKCAAALFEVCVAPHAISSWQCTL